MVIQFIPVSRFMYQEGKNTMKITIWLVGAMVASSLFGQTLVPERAPSPAAIVPILRQGDYTHEWTVLA